MLVFSRDNIESKHVSSLKALRYSEAESVVISAYADIELIATWFL
jgi:hypothetical protein